MQTNIVENHRTMLPVAERDMLQCQGASQSAGIALACMYLGGGLHNGASALPQSSDFQHVDKCRTQARRTTEKQAEGRMKGHKGASREPAGLSALEEPHGAPEEPHRRHGRQHGIEYRQPIRDVLLALARALLLAKQRAPDGKGTCLGASYAELAHTS